MSRRPESRQRGRQPYNTQLATERSGMCLFVHQSPNVAPPGLSISTCWMVSGSCVLWKTAVDIYMTVALSRFVTH